MLDSRPAPGGPGERLGDLEPVLGVLADRDQVGVVAVDALGDQQAEVVRRTGDPLCRVRPVPRSQVSPLGAVSSTRNSSAGGSSCWTEKE